jgi:hypothetical protein
MKVWLWMLVCVALCSIACAQDGRVPEEKPRLFSPRDMIWGYGEFDIAPPHNEPDPNLCAAYARNFGGKDAPCNAFARYLLSGHVEIHPFARTPLRRLMFFGDPTFVFGKNVPQALYTWSFDGIGWERAWGAGIEVGQGFQLRVTQHFLFQRFGVRDRYLGPADLGTNGPWGRYTVIGVRKYFGHHPAE